MTPDLALQLRRIALLQILAGAGRRRANEAMLRAAARHVGHAVSADRLRTDLRWLEEQGTLALEEIGGVLVATLTQRGVDVATGDAETPGIAPPAPDAAGG